MTNNEILNKIISQIGAISSIPIEMKTLSSVAQNIVVKYKWYLESV